MVWTLKKLNANGIFYEKPVNDEVKKYLLENHAQASIVTEGLLEFEHILSRSSFVSRRGGCGSLIDVSNDRTDSVKKASKR